MKGYTSRTYQGIPVGFEIRRQIGKDKIFRVRHGNGYYGSTLGELIQDKFNYVVPGSINNSEGSYARDFIREAVQAWQALSESAKNVWRAKEKSYPGRSGYSLFISDYIRRNYAVATFIEDADKDTKVETEKTADEDRVRIKTGGVYRAVVGPAGCETVYGFFHDRGDPTEFDFDQGDLTTDATWRDLDLSGIVPAGAKTVGLYVVILDDAVSSTLQFRKNGNTGLYNIGIVGTQVANVPIWVHLVVACDANRVIEYNGANLAFTLIGVLVTGWWK